jgi:hypothetical protein
MDPTHPNDAGGHASEPGVYDVGHLRMTCTSSGMEKPTVVLQVVLLHRFYLNVIFRLPV